MINIEGITIGQIILAGGSLMALYKIIQWAWMTFVKPKEDITKDISDIKAEIKQINEKLDNDYVTIGKHEQSLNQITAKLGNHLEEYEDVHEGLKVMLISQNQVLKSLLENGNNKEGLRSAHDQLTKYLQSKL